MCITFYVLVNDTVLYESAYEIVPSKQVYEMETFIFMIGHIIILGKSSI